MTTDDVKNLRAELKQLRVEMRAEIEWRDHEIDRLLKKVDQRGHETDRLLSAIDRLRDHYNRDLDRLESELKRLRKNQKNQS